MTTQISPEAIITSPKHDEVSSQLFISNLAYAIEMIGGFELYAPSKDGEVRFDLQHVERELPAAWHSSLDQLRFPALLAVA